MNPREFLARWRVHAVFAGLFLLVVVFYMTVGIIAGQTFGRAALRAFGEIRLLDYLMFALFWYVCARHRPSDDWRFPDFSESRAIRLSQVKLSARPGP